MNIPSRKECFRLIKQMKMMDHIIDHSVMVSNVSIFLCTALQKKCPHLNLKLAASAGLLHDITKTRSFTTQENHSLTGGQMLAKMGYPEVGDIVRQHVLLDHYEAAAPVSVEEIVNYSDKRVLHDRIVSLNRRLTYIQEKYGKCEKFKSRIRFMQVRTQDLEDKLFSFMEITPADLSRSVTEHMEEQDHA